MAFWVVILGLVGSCVLFDGVAAVVVVVEDDVDVVGGSVTEL